jgi:hypothetical protein
VRIVKSVLLILVVVVVIWILIDVIHVSDEEAIESLLDRGKAAVEQGDYAAVDGMVSLAYDFDGKDRDAFMRLAKDTLKQFAPMRIIVLKQEVVLEGEDAALVKTTVIVTPGANSSLPGPYRGIWKLHLAREDFEWKVTGLKPVG